MSQHDDFNARVERTKAEVDQEVVSDRRRRFFSRGGSDDLVTSFLMGLAESMAGLIPYIVVGGMGVMGVSIWLGISFWAALGLCFVLFILLAGFAAGNM